MEVNTKDSFQKTKLTDKGKWSGQMAVAMEANGKMASYMVMAY